MHVIFQLSWIIVVGFFVVHGVLPDNIGTVLVPTNLLAEPLILRPEARLHAFGKKRVRLREVDNVEPDVAEHVVFHTEHEPVDLVAAVGVVAHPYVEQTNIALANLVQVGTFKVGVKNDGFWESVLVGHFRLQHHLQLLLLLDLEFVFCGLLCLLCDLLLTRKTQAPQWSPFGPTARSQVR